MDDGLAFYRSQEEESRTARVIRKCSHIFTLFIKYDLSIFIYIFFSNKGAFPKTWGYPAHTT